MRGIGWHHSEDVKHKISQTMQGHKLSQKTKDKISHALTKYHKQCDSSRSEETKRKIAAAHRGKRCSNETKLKIAKSHRGKKHSEETKNKIRDACLNLDKWLAYKGGFRHQQFVKIISNQWDDGKRKVEIEKKILLPNNRMRVIDILINNNTCIEVGSCKRNKIEELRKYGFEVIHLPYSLLEVN